MLRRRLLLASSTSGAGVVAIFLLVRFVLGTNEAEAAPAPAAVVPPPAREGDTAVLLELFTSEGCSSCPPADDIARELTTTQPIAGARVIVLAHHVDYWNELGWLDPFSSKDATARQRSYALLGGGSYTPQAVLDGRAQMVGSRGAALRDAVIDAARRPHAKLEIGVAAASSERGVFDVGLKVVSLPEDTGDAEVVAAVVQDQARVVVTRGENRGHTLDHVATVRSLKPLETARVGNTVRTRVQLPAAIAGPERPTFSIVAFIQERAHRRVLGSVAAPLVAR